MMATPWALDPWLVKMYSHRLTPALSTLPVAPPLPVARPETPAPPASDGVREFLPGPGGELVEVFDRPRPPLPPPRDLGADAKQLREAFLRRLREHGPEVVRELRGAVAELRSCAAQGRALQAEMLWRRQIERATAFGGLVHAVVSSGKPTSKHDVLEAAGCRVSSGFVAVWLEHSAEHVIGLAKILTDGEQVYAEIALHDDALGRAAAEQCRTGALWACSPGYAALTTERRFYGLGERITEWNLREVSLTARPRDWRNRAVSTSSRAYAEVARRMGFPTKEERRA